MNWLKPALDAVSNVTKIVPSALKDHNKKLSSKRIFKLGGGGYLVYEGIEFLEKAMEVNTEVNSQMALYSGIGCIVVGAFIAIGLSMD